MYEFTQFDNINPLTGEGYPIGMNPPPGNESVVQRDNWQRKNNPPEVEKKIIGVIDAILCPAAPGNPAVTVSKFDTTTYIDRAIVQFQNSTGGASELGNFSIKGKIVYQISNAANGRSGSRYWEHTDYGDIEKYGEKEMKVANEFIFSGAQVEDIGDYVRKEMKPHDMYTLALRGYHPYFSPGDLWTLTVNHSLPASTSEQELIDTDVQICGVSIRKDPKTIGETILSVRVPSGAWSKTTSTRAKTAVSGLPSQNLSRTNEITIAPRDNPNQADYHCTGTNDELIILSAINKAGAAGGGTVKLLRGNFYVVKSTLSTCVEINHNSIQIIGEGIGNTIVNYVAEATPPGRVFYINGDAFTIRDLTVVISGTYASTAAHIADNGTQSGIAIIRCNFTGGSSGISLSTSNGIIINNNIISTGYLGINASGPGTVIMGNNITVTSASNYFGIVSSGSSVKITDNTINMVGDDAVGPVTAILSSHSRSLIKGNDIIFSGTFDIAASANSSAINAGSSGAVDGVISQNNIQFGGTWDTASGIWGIYIGAEGCGINNNKIGFSGTWACSAAVYGIYCITSNCNISSNNIIGDDFVGTPDPVGIRVTQDYNTVTGNRVTGFVNTGAGTGFGMAFASTSLSNNITGNTTIGNNTATTDAGTSNLWTGNN